MDTNVYEFFKNRKYLFSTEVLTSYILALKTKPFVILTGISGTGKTKIAQIFADYLTQDEQGQEARKRRIAFVPVRPDWMDNRGLLGFFNPITNKYQATPVLNLLLEARKEENRNLPYFIILDEMNLAKVEYYFSDFLSIMESRTINKREGEVNQSESQGDKAKGQFLRLHDQRFPVGTKDDDQDFSVKTEDGLLIPPEIEIPPNVFFTGTVNVDETTYMFSPKVLDRANVIEFNEVVLPGYSDEQTGGDSFRLRDPDVRERFKNEKRQPFCTKADYDEYYKLLKELKKNDQLAELFQLLKPHHLHFGYRVINEVSRSVVLASEQVSDFDLDTALDIQFLQKILPKLHGTKGKLQKPLNKIFRYCYDKDGDSDPDRNELEKAMNYDANARFPRTAQKVARMLDELVQQGYTSFIQ